MLHNEDDHPEDTDGEPDLVARLCIAIESLCRTTENPYLLIGALIEAAAFVAHRSIPDDEQEETAAAMLSLLWARLNAYGLNLLPDSAARKSRSSLLH